jgi:4-hydroxy-tetrahydrodipicolinate synthase
VDEAAVIHQRLLPIFEGVFCTASPVPTKALFRALGLDVGDTRLPLVMSEITDDQVASLEAIVEELGRYAVALPQPATTTA